MGLVDGDRMEAHSGPSTATDYIPSTHLSLVMLKSTLRVEAHIISSSLFPWKLPAEIS
jgi:hypothetical protein